MKDDKASFYGFKCFAIGYEFSPGPEEVRMNYLLILLRKIVFLRATVDLGCACCLYSRSLSFYFKLGCIIYFVV